MRSFQQNEAVAGLRDLFIGMVDSADHVTPKTGLTLTVAIVKAGGSGFGAIAGSSAEIGNGCYKISLAAGDLDTLGQAMLKITAAGADALLLPIAVARWIAEIHQVKANALNAKDALSDSPKTERVMDDDGTTLLKTISFAESIDVAGANWTNGTKTITLAGAFAKYIWKTGDVFTLSAGTGATIGQYAVASKTSDDAIVLATDINGAGGDISDNTVAGVVSTGRLMRTVA